MTIIVPMWFYEFGLLMYSFAAAIGLALTYFSFKLYNYTRKKSHLLLNLSFVFITIGFIILAISNTYSIFHFEQCNPTCTITAEDPFRWIILGNDAYYLTSIVGYSLFLLSYPLYGKKDKKKLLLQIAPPLALNIIFPPEELFVLYPFESIFFQPFHVISAILVFLVVLRTFSNYRKIKTTTSLLLPIGFAAILLYHVLMLSLGFSPLFFAFAHLSLLAGFSVLLVMLIKVTRK